MTVEPIEQLLDEEHYSAELQRLQRAVDSLLRPESLSKLNPYKTELPIPKRFEKFKAFVTKRGRRYAACSLDNFRVTDDSISAVADLRAFCNEIPDRLASGNAGLVLLGPPGTGKDHLLMGAMREAMITHGVDVRWYDGLALFDEIKSRIADNSVRDFVRELSKFPILAISDPVPPRDMLSAYELGKLREIVDYRYSNQMATWITTNVQTAQDANLLFTEAVLGRLLDGALEVFCNWPSYRKPA